MFKRTFRLEGGYDKSNGGTFAFTVMVKAIDGKQRRN